MRQRKQIFAPFDPDDIERLIARAARQGVALNSASASKALAPLGILAAIRKLDGVCRLIQAARNEDHELSFRLALRRVDTCGGNVEEAIRRMLAGGSESSEGIPETVQYAGDRGVLFSPNSISNLFAKHGRGGARRYIDKLAAIMDAASTLDVDCPQTLASRRLSLADGDAQHVIANFIAEHRRRADRRTVRCRVAVPPPTLNARSNAFAGCGCPRCCDRLASQLQPYISKMIAGPFFTGLDREEARAEANLELLRSVETWRGGSNFAGWFAAHFKSRVQTTYRSRSAEEREMLSLDAPAVLANDDGGRAVPLGERIPDRSIDVLEIVLLRERFAEAALTQRQLRADRGEEFTNDSSADPGSSNSPRPLRLVSPVASPTDRAETMSLSRPSRKAA
jgi:DNA-directed RNA polymerase specialized sigma24 family protein